MGPSVAETLIALLRKLPRDERVPVIRAILRKAGKKYEDRVLQLEKERQEFHGNEKGSLVGALEQTIHEPGGYKILEVIGGIAAREVADRGKIAPSMVGRVAGEYADVLKKHDAEADVGLGFIGTAISAGVAVLGTAISAISNAIKKKRAYRRELKAKYTQLNDAEIGNIVDTVVPPLLGMRTVQAWQAAQEQITPMISQLRNGRTGYLLDPPNTGSKVNEYKKMRQAFYSKHSQLRNALLADKKKKEEAIGLVAAVGGALMVGGIAYAVI